MGRQGVQVSRRKQNSLKGRETSDQAATYQYESLSGESQPCAFEQNEVGVL